MKTIGLLGGMSWESTAIYYRLINQGVKARLGGHHSAKIVLYSVDFAEIERLQATDRWDEAGQLLANAAQSLERAGAEFIVLCTNTMHNVASSIESAVSIPLVHIADPTAQAIQAAKVKTVGLLGTKFTMEKDFYTGRLRSKHGLNVLVPNESQREQVHRVIYDELVHGVVREDSRRTFLGVIEELRVQGAQAVIFGCTEITMLVTADILAIPSFDTTALHANAAVELSLV